MARVSFKQFSTAALQAEIERRKRATGPLMRKRDRLLKLVAQLNAKLGDAAANNGSPRRGGKRSKNEMSLVDALRKVMKGRTMGVQEAADAVQKAGYRSSSKTFRVVVAIAIANNRKAFKRVERGRYKAA